MDSSFTRQCLAFARHTISRCPSFRANFVPWHLFDRDRVLSTHSWPCSGLKNVISCLCEEEDAGLKITCIQTHIQVPPVPTYMVKMGCVFGYCFPGPLLQRSLWTGHPFLGQVRESCILYKTPNLTRSILAEKLVWPTTWMFLVFMLSPLPNLHDSQITLYSWLTLSGILLENPTLCGTEVGQNGTLAILAYVHCRHWECF